ncbi:unnamed protein product [Mytilus edulis]|uniref:Uncharacterized protein n=1 Tax=Mytilus edulis TaxID=6550 RepID=A0A8S3U275_MYTED|nr:unnamed protein product [Mytilus edulis]
MSHSKSESLHFYEYLCQKIGSKKVVSARRLTYICRDLKGQLKDIPQITSGSKGEGVDIKGSDFDIMYIDQDFVVYESENDAVHDSRKVFVMDNEDTQPCYTYLQLHSKYKVLHYSFKQILQQHRGKTLLSSERYKLHKLSLQGDNAKINRIHGPCLSDITDDYDLACCLKCDQKFPCEITRSVCENSSLMKTIIKLQDTYPTEPAIQNINIVGMFNTLYHHCKTELSSCILTLLIANAYQRLPLEQQQIVRPNNKQQYKNYKLELSQLLVGVHSGWLKLASFFYVRKNYLTSLCMINYTLSKCTYESTISKITLKEAIQTQKLKLMILSKTMPSLNVIFAQHSPISPVELKIDVMKHWIKFNSIQFAHFLRFLCCYHHGDISSCLNSMLQLKGTAFGSGPPRYTLFTYEFMSLGISAQMLGNSYLAKCVFSIIAEHDKYNETSAAYRLRQLC